LRLILVAHFWGKTCIAGRRLALEMPHFVAASARSSAFRPEVRR
jgi:hypothetical protein